MGQFDKLRRQTSRLGAVRMGLGKSPSPSRPNRLVRRIGFHRQDHIGILRPRPQMGGPDAAEGQGIKTKKPRHLLQIIDLMIGDRTIGLGNVKQTIHHIFKQLWAGPVTFGQTFGIALKAERCLTRQIIEPLDITDIF